MAFVGKGFRFYHMPRTGGSWVKSRLAVNGAREIGEGHDWPAVSHSDVDNRMSFTVRRNPFTWLPSWLRVLYANPKREWSSRIMPELLFEDCDCSSFESFWGSYQGGLVDRVYNAYGAVDRILNFEQLEFQFASLVNEAGIETIDLPDRWKHRQLNKTRDTGYRCNWTPELVELAAGRDAIFDEYKDHASLEAYRPAACGADV